MLAFLALILAKPAFGPIDDHTLITTVIRGVRFPFSIHPEIGRFFPLNGQEFNLVPQSSTSPFWYYAVNAVEFACFSVVLWNLLRLATGRAGLITGLAFLLLLSPASTDSWFRLLVPERTSTLLFGIFLVMYYKAQAQRKVLPAVLGVVSGTLALYYKEPGFLALGAFATVHLVLTWRTSPRFSKILDTALLASSAIFALVYFVVIYSHRGDALYGAQYSTAPLILLRTAFTYAMTDPALVLGLLPLAAYRMWKVIKEPGAALPFFDSMLAGGTMYVLAYFVLRLRSPHYLLPAYVFALPPLIYYVSESGGRRVKQVLAVAIFSLYLMSALPIGLFTLSQNKYVPINYSKTIAFLRQDLAQSESEDRPMIFLDGVNRGSGIESYVSLVAYLEWFGLRFDVGSEQPSNDSAIYHVDPSSKYSVFRDPGVLTPKRGELVVACECYSLPLNKSYFEHKELDYDLLFSTHSPLAIPDLSLRNVAKYLVSELSPQSGLIGGGRNFHRGPDYYVFRKR